MYLQNQRGDYKMIKGSKKENGKTTYLNIRLRPDERQMIKDMAKKRGKTVTDYLLGLVKKDAEVE